MLRLTFKYPHVHPTIEHATNPETRKRVFLANDNKLAQNAAVFKETLRLRDEAARLLRLVPVAQKELDQLKGLKAEHCKKHGMPDDEEFYVWDRTCYKRILLEESRNVDQLGIAEYFPLGETVDGMLRIFETVMGLVFVKLDDDDLARLSLTGSAEDVKWHDDNIVYSAWEDETHGSTFPTPGKPSLLKHHEFVNLFHELGHTLHNITSKTRYCKMYGTADPRDFVEVPSQMLEHWCWTPSVLQSLSQHWATKAQMPDDLLQSLIASKNTTGALDTLRELRTAKFDLMCHMPKNPEEAAMLDPAVIFNELGASVGLIPGLETETKRLDWGHAYANFSHWMGGMESSVYGYLYSPVYSADMFYSAFKQDLMSTKQGRRYRHAVIERGNTRDEMDGLREFLGREPNAEAFYEDLGISIGPIVAHSSDRAAGN
ncbi:Neurolysin/Thimet oligopeptidase, domain 2 [Akanthomyces lecanii RCEF 1005]|uniref:Neurolysin/Thimet oligopeptidase, domain 2 n=1 Tax=Akanthomyces lecanii RCEF 1005 TaxID=1081108 RepID=A0A168JCI4_CORDF|nr:Neurolysin/Thimet oligopeptidase, domain 2 [Akanthomyces lecanii RCEF 1005]